MIDRYMMDWRLSHPNWEGWGGGKKLLHEIIPRFGLLRSLQSDNGTSFTSKITQGVSKALGVTYYLHCAWRPQSSGKGEKANQFFFIFFIVVDFVIHWNETAMGLHVFPIPIPPPTSLSTQSLYVFPAHQVQALVSCIQPGLVMFHPR